MKKSFLIIFLLVFLFSSGLPSLVIGQTITTSSEEVISATPIIKIKSAGSFINDGKNLLKETWQKVAGSKRGEVITKIKAWFTQRKQAIQNGWQEEKQEFSGNIKDIIAKAWQKAIDKVKSWVFHKKGD